jgi:hypothetical protein
MVAALIRTLQPIDFGRGRLARVQLQRQQGAPRNQKHRRAACPHRLVSLSLVQIRAHVTCSLFSAGDPTLFLSLGGRRLSSSALRIPRQRVLLKRETGGLLKHALNRAPAQKGQQSLQTKKRLQAA